MKAKHLLNAILYNDKVLLCQSINHQMRLFLCKEIDAATKKTVYFLRSEHDFDWAGLFGKTVETSSFFQPEKDTRIEIPEGKTVPEVIFPVISKVCQKFLDEHNVICDTMQSVARKLPQGMKPGIIKLTIEYAIYALKLTHVKLMVEKWQKTFAKDRICKDKISEERILFLDTIIDFCQHQLKRIYGKIPIRDDFKDLENVEKRSAAYKQLGIDLKRNYRRLYRLVNRYFKKYHHAELEGILHSDLFLEYRMLKSDVRDLAVDIREAELFLMEKRKKEQEEILARQMKKNQNKQD